MAVPPLWQQRIGKSIRSVLFAVSVVTIGAIVIDYGFVLDEKESGWINSVYLWAWRLYFMVFAGELALNLFRIPPKRRIMTMLTGAALLLSALPRFWAAPENHHLMAALWELFEGKYFTVALLALFALMEISRGLVGIMGKNTNPALVMVSSFAVMIFIGTILLLVPRSTMPHIRLPIIDALFVATSAVCVTGLSPVDIASTFTPEGQMVLMLLVQVGGLGVMTITSFFALFFMGNTGVYNQYTLRDMVGGSETSQSLVSMLLYILGFTFAIELAGAACIWLSVRGTLDMSLHEELFFAMFHSVSAFCNAGFSTLAGNLGNEALMEGGNAFYIIISALVVLGGIGFPILVNFRNIIVYHLRRMWWRFAQKRTHRPRYNHLVNINTRIVLMATAALVAVGTLLMALIEWNGAFAAMSVGEKLTQSLFHAVVPRTAGFNSVDLTHLSLLAALLYMVLMWIGGASQSTAGGIKVNTFAVACANFVAVVRGRSRVEMLGREIDDNSLRRAAAVVFGSILAIIAGFVTLVVMEPDIAPLGLLFEVVSALCTVGSSLNVTPELGDGAKFVVSVLMFSGRVGIIAMITAMVRHSGDRKYRFPKDNIIIN